MQIEINIPMSERVKLSDLKFDGKNPNSMTKDQRARLRVSLIKWGDIVPIITNKDLLVADGQQRAEEMMSMGLTECSVIRLPIEEVDRRLLRQVLNKLRGEHELLLDAEEFETIIDLGHEDDLKFLLNLSDEKIQKYLQELHPNPLKPNGITNNLKNAKILNLYAGIGGNRKFWGELDITAIEYNKDIAECYQKFYPTDKVLVEDAHVYLEKHFDEYDFIWTSPPCPTHSRIRKNLGVPFKPQNFKAVYPDLKLYEEILFLQGYFKGKWVVENVISWYDPLVEPIIRGRHYFWSNFNIPEIELPSIGDTIGESYSSNKENDWESEEHIFNHAKNMGFEHPELIPNKSEYPRDKIIRNCCHPLLGEHIINSAFSEYQKLVNNG